MFVGVGDDELVDVVGQMHGIHNASMRIFLAGLVEVDQRQVWRVDGASSVEMWLELRHGVSRSTARSWVRLARGLVFCPALAAAFDAGRLSLDQLRSAVDLVAFGHADDAVVAVDAVGRSAAELDRLAREARRVSRQEAEQRARDRYLRTRWDRDGMLHLHGRLADAEGKVVETAIRRLAEDQPKDTTAATVTFDQRQADALHALASASLAADADPDLATVVIHVDAHALANTNDAVDLATMPLGAVISLATAHRLACDGRCQVVVDDLLGRTVQLAKTTHAVPRWLRRRCINRDHGCRWPSCDRTALLHAHHIAWWTRDGGQTEETNLVMLCPYHHRLVHEGEWTIEGDPTNRLRFTRRGHHIQTGPPGLRPEVRDALGLTWSGDPPAHAA